MKIKLIDIENVLQTYFWKKVFFPPQNRYEALRKRKEFVLFAALALADMLEGLGYVKKISDGNYQSIFCVINLMFNKFPDRIPIS
jgi:hypothetical protein